MARGSGAETRMRIMDVSEALILDNGYTATSIDEIVERAGITKGTFFYHFPSKAALVQELVERFSHSDLSTMHANLARAEQLSRDPLQQLLIFVGLYVEMAEGMEEPYPG